MKALIFGLLVSSFSHAYFVATPPNQKALDYSASTYILVSGRGTDLGMQPQKSALGRALLYKNNFPNRQVVLISVFEHEKNEPLLRQLGWSFVVNNNKKFETQIATAEIAKFKKIKSLEFFGHNSPSLGTQMDGKGYRYDVREPAVHALAPLFDQGAYAIFHGCNSGWIMAQELSKIWQIPVAGSFTGTRFERLHSDGQFYVYTSAKAPNDKWAQNNPNLNVSCDGGGCIRMRPSYSHYNGQWGNFQGPFLSHYKFFCQGDETQCEKTMALSLFGYLSEKSLTRDANLQDFRKAAKEYLCPVYKDRKITEDCYAQLDLIEAKKGNLAIAYGVGDPQLRCDLKSCTGKMLCDNKTCKATGQVSANATTLANEYLHFIKGFEALKAEDFN